MPKRPRGQPRGDQRWSTLVRNHAAAILACDFCVVVTATFLTENHLCIVTKDWVTHYNRGRPHTSLRPGIPDPQVDLPVTPHKHRHRIPSHCKVIAHPILGGLHHEYGLASKAA